MMLAKTLDELYEEVRDYDLVLCNDAPLALALNNRMDRPRVGDFATTPRRLAGDMVLDILGEPTESDIRIVRSISKVTGYGMRFVHGEVEHIKRIRRFTPDVGSRIRGRTRKVYAEYSEIPTLDKAMGLFDGMSTDLFRGKKVAVIGLDLFDDLDKHFNPKAGTFDEISPFKRGDFSIKTMRVMGNDRQIADNATSLVTRENASDVAIVMDVGSPIANAVRSSLYRKRIPFMNTLSVRDLNNIRDYLEFLDSSLSFNTVRVRHVRELLSSYGGYIPSKYDEYLLQKYSDFKNTNAERSGTRTATVEIMETMRHIEEMRFIDVCEKVVPKKDRPSVKILLDEMELADEIVDRAKVADLTYAVNNIGDLKHNEQIPEDEKTGVLLVDCKKSVYIDRPIVMYLGLDSSWDKNLTEYDFLNRGEKEDENEANLIRFQILLQQGTSRFYFASRTKGGEETTPCQFFNDALDPGEPVAVKMEDVCDDIVYGIWNEGAPPKGRTFGETGLESSHGQDLSFSKSTYDAFMSCPRLFMYNRLCRTPDNRYTRLGTMVHQYAEFRACHPNEALELGIEGAVEMIAEKNAGLIAPESSGVEMSIIRTAVENVDRFVAQKDITDLELSPKDTEHGNNIFFERFGLSDSSTATEVKFKSDDRTMHGEIDLFHDDIIYDYKTGKPLRPSEVSKSMKDAKDKIEYQALFYLSLVREQCPGCSEFDLFFILGNDVRIARGEDVRQDENIVRVVLLESFDEYLRVGLQDTLIKKKKYETIVENYDGFLDALQGLDFSDTNAANDTRAIESMCGYAGIHTQTFKNSVKDAIKIVCKKHSEKGIIAENDANNVFVTQEALDAFRAELLKKHEESILYSGTSYPAVPVIDCRKCDCCDLCTATPREGGDEDV